MKPDKSENATSVQPKDNHPQPIIANITESARFNTETPTPKARSAEQPEQHRTEIAQITPPPRPTVPLHPPIPDEWLRNNHQDLMANNVFDQDTDGDGFTTLEEFYGNTDPSNKDSHPPYWTKLYLKRFVRVPFHLRFEAKHEEKFFINETDDEEAATQVKKVGETVKLGKYTFKLTAFKEKFDTSQGFTKDVSELTLTNVDTGQTVILPKGANVDSPTTYAVLSYLWNGPGAKPEFAVQKDGEFTLAPENNVRFKVVELSDTDVTLIKEDENKTLHVKTSQASADQIVNSTNLISVDEAAKGLPPVPTKYFNDYTMTVSPATCDRLNMRLANFEKDTSDQLLVTIYSKVNSPLPTDEYAAQLMKAWGVGQRGKNNGLVLVISVEDRRMGICFGVGLKPLLTDEIVKKITPYLSDGKWDEGLTTGVTAILDAIGGEKQH